MSKPSVKPGINFYDVVWDEEQIRIRASRLTETNVRGMQADLLVSTMRDLPATHIHQSTLGLYSLSGRNELVRHLKKVAPDYEWESMIEQVCVLIPRYYRTGEPVETIYALDESVAPPESFIDPIILRNEINMIFGEGGAGKSYLALYLALIATMRMSNSLNLKPPNVMASVLLLDWETYKGQIQWRWKMVANGMGLVNENIGLEYRRCSIPLVDDLERIQAIILEKKIDFAIIDSVAMASGADINTPETAIRFMNAVRQLPCTILLIHHTSKDSLGRKSPFGSVYFTNASRSVWEIKNAQQPGSDSIKIGLWHTKHNYSAKSDPIGAEIVFGQDSVTFNPINVIDIPEFQDKAPMLQRLERTIQDSGPMTAKDFSTILNVAPSQITYVLKANPEKFIGLKGFKPGEETWDLVK